MLLIGQLKEIYVDGELEMVDTTNWFPKVLRKDFTVGMVVNENGVDDPDQIFYENYACGAARNYGGYCDRAVDALIDQQSMEADAGKRAARRCLRGTPSVQAHANFGDALMRPQPASSSPPLFPIQSTFRVSRSAAAGSHAAGTPRGHD